MADDTIDSLPKLLSRLPGLEVLRMRYCQLGRLECMHGHDSYGRTLYLYASFLDLDGPAIDRLTTALRHNNFMPGLKVLDFSQNRYMKDEV